MASPRQPARGSGRSVLAGVRARLKHGWPSGLTVLTGEDRYHLDLAQREILEHLDGSDPSAYGRTVLGEEEVEIPRVVGAALARGMFTSRRVVFVRDVMAIKGEIDDLKTYASNPPDGSFLVIRAVKLDRKRKIHQFLAGAPGLLEFEMGGGEELARETVEMGRDRGLELDRAAGEFLVDACLFDLHRVAAELEKVRCYLGDAAPFRVDLSIVREVVAASNLSADWAVANAVLLRSTKDALSAVRQAVEAGEEPLRIVGGLAWRARVMLQGKALLSSGMSSRDVVSAVRAWAFERSFLDGLGRYSLAELLAFPARLLQADRQLKSSGLAGAGVTILETLVSDLTGEDPERRGGSMTGAHETVLILDFGSQFTQLIARRVRELSVYCEVLPFSAKRDEIAARGPVGIILSGGPCSVYDEGAPHPYPGVYELGVPVLGVCYGMQLMAQALGGEVEPVPGREFGPAVVTVDDETSVLFRGLAGEHRVWASHGDNVRRLPAGFRSVASSVNAPVAAVEAPERRLFGVQFHPEVAHTERGREILRNFLFDVCGCRGDWTISSFVEQSVEEIRERVGGGRVVEALSGGVDSAVLALLLQRALGDRVICVFVDNGLLRKGEAEQVLRDFRERHGLEVVFAAESGRFLGKLAGVEDPERKRKIIGETFIQVFEERARALGGVAFLAQGTIYPDRIESASVQGPSATIKTHHNVGGLPERMNLSLLEPLRDLFKDEVRKVGATLGLDPAFLHRHPFPGPGLGVRVLGEVTADRVAVLQEADDIFVRELRRSEWYDRVAQAFAVLLPVKSVGVMGDGRTYDNVVALRAVTTQDFMTADWARLPHDFLARVSSRIVNEVRGVNRVVYDVTSKPPGTIEWE